MTKTLKELMQDFCGNAFIICSEGGNTVVCDVDTRYTEDNEDYVNRLLDVEMVETDETVIRIDSAVSGSQVFATYYHIPANDTVEYVSKGSVELDGQEVTLAF